MFYGVVRVVRVVQAVVVDKKIHLAVTPHASNPKHTLLDPYLPDLSQPPPPCMALRGARGEPVRGKRVAITTHERQVPRNLVNKCASRSASVQDDATPTTCDSWQLSVSHGLDGNMRHGHWCLTALRFGTFSHSLVHHVPDRLL